MVLWNKPLGGNAIYGYLVEWYEKDSYKESRSKYVEHVFGKTNYTSVITNLQSGTKYTVSVLAKNSVEGGYSQSADITLGKYNFNHVD